MRTLALKGLIIGAILLGCAPAAQVQANDVFLHDAPVGFKLVKERRRENDTVFEYIPEVETVDDWTEHARVSIVSGLQHISPIRHSERIAADWLKMCPEGSAENLGEKYVNGYPSVTWIVRCPGSSPRDSQYVVAYTTQGKDALYNVAYTFLRDIGEPELSKALSYINSVALCDQQDPNHPCPPEN